MKLMLIENFLNLATHKHLQGTTQETRHLHARPEPPEVDLLDGEDHQTNQTTNLICDAGHRASRSLETPNGMHHSSSEDISLNEQ